MNRASWGGSQTFNIGFRRRIFKGKACGLSVWRAEFAVPSSEFRVWRSEVLAAFGILMTVGRGSSEPRFGGRP